MRFAIFNLSRDDLHITIEGEEDDAEGEGDGVTVPGPPVLCGKNKYIKFYSPLFPLQARSGANTFSYYNFLQLGR